MNISVTFQTKRREAKRRFEQTKNTNNESTNIIGRSQMRQVVENTSWSEQKLFRAWKHVNNFYHIYSGAED